MKESAWWPIRANAASLEGFVKVPALNVHATCLKSNGAARALKSTHTSRRFARSSAERRERRPERQSSACQKRMKMGLDDRTRLQTEGYVTEVTSAGASVGQQLDLAT